MKIELHARFNSSQLKINLVALTTLSKQVAQCFYITDPQAPNHVVTRRGKGSIVEMDDVVDEEDYDQFDDPDTNEDDEANKNSRPTKWHQTTLL
jgi:hypothetical protein